MSITEKTPKVNTVNSHSNRTSEILITKASAEYNIPQNRIVIMTKLYCPVFDPDSPSRPNPAINNGELVNQMGLSRKKYIFDTPEEIMGALHDLVRMGKLARLQYTAKMNNWTTFTSMRGLWNLLYREKEREVNPFYKTEGNGLIPWSQLARGLLARPWNAQTYRSSQDKKTVKWFSGEQNKVIVSRVEQLAKMKGCSMSAVAITWLLKKDACPIVGLNSMERIESAGEESNLLRDVSDPWTEWP
ncbi:Aldo/keto reductase [Aspergillus vadensis CBS 113365]|uniref:Aldo/keto reductase n=1 Tax=Aspergillus vadensis (strain CBS 113365 / IMI 142717 / IBT 24658) TaxID=1448311 RepID=A0A319BAY1_ASPVC|nr:Aldo/keto reductase [Aspergillus vadensis CBS 113365]PYH69024.1 Aldo/keto reductase [Aspergillus vadensis CBS 113365]